MIEKHPFLDLLEQKKYEEAMAICDQELTKNPDDAIALSYKAKTFARQKIYGEALEYIDKAIAIKQEPAFYFSKARWLVHTKNFAAIPDLLEQGIKIDHEYLDYYYSSVMYFYKAYAEMKLGRKKECISSLSYLEDEYFSLWIDGKLWSKKEILEAIQE